MEHEHTVETHRGPSREGKKPKTSEGRGNIPRAREKGKKKRKKTKKEKNVKPSNGLKGDGTAGAGHDRFITRFREGGQKSREANGPIQTSSP